MKKQSFEDFKELVRQRIVNEIESKDVNLKSINNNEDEDPKPLHEIIDFWLPNNSTVLAWDIDGKYPVPNYDDIKKKIQEILDSTF